ncbi:MAG: hypothetical protein ACTSV9_08295 [Candidatus Thorarchaeota archaeon]
MSGGSTQRQEENERYKRLRNEKLFIVGLLALVAGFMLATFGSEAGYQTGNVLIILGALLVLFGIARYVAKRVSDEGFWWSLKTGPFQKPV